MPRTAWIPWVRVDHASGEGGWGGGVGGGWAREAGKGGRWAGGHQRAVSNEEQKPNNWFDLAGDEGGVGGEAWAGVGQGGGQGGEMGGGTREQCGSNSLPGILTGSW